MKLSIIIPVYNEENTIKQVIIKVKKTSLPIKREIIVVDDFSQDKTREILKIIPGVRVFYHNKNQGKGAAIRTGLKHSKGDVIIIQDADLEYDPEDISNLLRPILKKEAVVVYGTRFKGTYEHKKSLNYYGNRLITHITNLLFGSDLTEVETCYKVFRKNLLGEIQLTEDRFGFEPEITTQFLKKKMKIKEIPISYNPRGYAEGKKINWKDGIWAVWVLLRERIWPDQLLYDIFKVLRTRYVLKHVTFSGSVLDLACGDKYFLNKLNTNKKVGLDRIYGDEIKNRLDFPDKFFDYVTILAAIEHFEEPKPIIKECHRILKDRGKFIITTPKKRTHGLINVFWPETHEKYYTPEILAKLLSPEFKITINKEFEFGLNQFFVCEKNAEAR